MLRLDSTTFPIPYRDYLSSHANCILHPIEALFPVQNYARLSKTSEQYTPYLNFGDTSDENVCWELYNDVKIDRVEVLWRYTLHSMTLENPAWRVSLTCDKHLYTNHTAVQTKAIKNRICRTEFSLIPFYKANVLMLTRHVERDGFGYGYAHVLAIGLHVV